MTRRQRTPFPWFAMLIGLLAGFGGGLYYSWFLDPVNRVDIGPNQLVPADQEAYILLISEAYHYDHDLERARARLSALGVKDTALLVSNYADTAYLQAEGLEKVCSFTALAEALGGNPLAGDVCAEAAVAAPPPVLPTTPTATFAPMPSITPTSGATATPSPSLPTLTPTVQIIPPDTIFILYDRDILCESSHRTGLIQIFVYDAFDEGLPGVEIEIEWDGNFEYLFTGLKPQIDPGYADFRMEPDKVYSVTLVGLADPVVGLVSNSCTLDTGSTSLPTIQLIFSPEIPEEENGG